MKISEVFSDVLTEDTHHDCVNNKIHREFLDLKLGEGIFVLSEDEKSKLKLSNKELTLIKPYFTSDQIGRYYTNKSNKFWIIYTDSKFKDKKSMNKYPKLKSHLNHVGKAITSDNKPYGLHRAREEHFFKGENYQVDKEPLLAIPLPNPATVSKEKQQEIITLVDKILATKKSSPQADTTSLEAEIDKKVYALYELTEDEIKIVENSSK